MATGGKITRAAHIVNNTNIVQLESVYENIGTVCGITPLVGDVPPGAETSDLQDLVRNGVIRRAKVRVNNTSTTDGAPKYVTRIVYFAATNASQIGALAGKDLITGQVTIRSAYFPQRITLG